MAEDTLQNREDLLQAIFESTQDAIIILDDKMCCLRANPSAGIITGIPNEQLVGRFLPDFVDTCFDLPAAWSAFIQTGRFAGEVAIKHIEGGFRTVEATGIANILPGQHLFIGHDITERKQSEIVLQDAKEELEAATKELRQQNGELLQTQTALLDSEEKYRTLFEHSLDAIILTDPRGGGRIISANPAACQMLGWSEEELIGKGREIMFDLEDPVVLALLKERAHSGSAKAQLIYKRKDGTSFPGEISTSLFTDRKGEPRAINIIRDISERKRADESLQQSEEKYRHLVEG
ncbi:MAG TPA: PAS domain S-box protein, partial [Methanotrichaceae archaeon]|nr:PAS domain S-box protein [Methanotrichaceae archaeon]